jgi:hypothetical protein
MRFSKNITLLILTLISLGTKVWLQPCSVAQILTIPQQTQIQAILSPLDTALKYEDYFHIDSLHTELKNLFAAQGGLPEDTETYYTLVTNATWLDLNQALVLSRLLIGVDSMEYVDLWKAAKGMAPPLYQPHSVFLRAAAEIAMGLLKIADQETDLTRKTLYQSWATRALDSLATMQLPSGAFPFPDLRTYNDPVFTPIIQNFLNACGADSVNVLQGGWIVDDKGTGEFKFDAGVMANVYYTAYQYTGNTQYKNICIAIGNYLMPLKFNRNYNYNTFVSLGLTRAFQLTGDTTYLNRAIINLRYAIYPGQIPNGRWVDGHNASSRYHNLMVHNMVPTTLVLPAGNPHKNKLDTMTLLSIKNLVDYTFSCHSATGYRWLIKAYQLNTGILSPTLFDSITQLIGQHINQSAFNAKYLDVPTMGDYLELLGLPTGIETVHSPPIEVNLFPNPTQGAAQLTMHVPTTTLVYVALADVYGRVLNVITQGLKTTGTYTYQMDVSQQPGGMYFIILNTPQQNSTIKMLVTK